MNRSPFIEDIHEVIIRLVISNASETPPHTELVCDELALVGYMFVFLFIAGIVANSSLIWLLARRKELCTPLNTFVVALTVVDLFGTIAELPFVIVAHLLCR